MNVPKSTALARIDDDAREVPREPESRHPGEGGFGALTPERARVLLIVAARASSVTLLVIFGLVFATLFAAGSGLTGASGAIAASWLAVHQVPLVIGKTALGLWPLLPTGFILWMVGRDCARAAEPECGRADLGWIAGAAVGGPLLVTAICLAVADDASAVVALQPPDTPVAFAWVIGLHGLAAAVGIGSRRWRELVELLPIALPDWVIPGVLAGLRALYRLLAVATGLTIVSFLVHWSRIGDTYQGAGNIVGVVGLTLLSLAYLPNIVIDAVSVLLGGQVRIGEGSLSVFAIDGAPVPAVPLAAAVPSGPVAIWWLVLLLVPAAVGVLSGLDCGRHSDDRPAAPWATLTAAGVGAVLLTLLGVFAGGDLGTFGWIGPNVLLSAALAFLWLAVPGYVGMLGARWFAPAAGTAAAVEDEYDEYDDDYDDYDDEDYPDGDEYADDEDYADGGTEYADDEYDDYDDEYDESEDDEPATVAEDDDCYFSPDDPDRPEALEAELVDDEPADHPTVKSDENADIVDAEVVEGDVRS
ncbi:hypothetical protein H0264_09645 [Nocardia huaxiensis]|uniref:Uncharacterized protein n=1 Tax=Nocardia huaxiensis TaxID=2755382 RepID=A0A7D6ZS24_9NOCA|nr:DUF6350 family protein [Nocardia huaxiensis]QLY32485.1 hypothetical protein H0264_09645 [Nocardia huaxiensis]